MKPNEIKIESGIPIPERYCGDQWVKVLKGLKKGNSFTVQTEGERNCALNRAKACKIKITTRKVDGEGFRIWKQ